MEPPLSAQERLARELADLRLVWMLAWLPFAAWLLPKLGLRLKPEYQAMLDEDRATRRAS